MYQCPHCRQELKSFALNCMRCSRAVGTVKTDGVMLAAWWLDADGEPVEKIGVKTLVKAGTTVDAKSVDFVSSVDGRPQVVITLSSGEEIPQTLLEFFHQASNPTQEWKI